MAALTLYPTSKYQLHAVSKCLDGADILLGLEVFKTACLTGSTGKVTKTYFYAKDRGVQQEQLHGVIEKLSKAGLIRAESVVGPKGDLDFKLALTAEGMQLFVDAKAEIERSYQEWQAKKG